MLDPIYIVGPTAAGKSDIAVEVTESIDGEVVGADAFQVYRGLDVLTAKPSASTLARVPHHLVGEIPLTQPFDVVQYREMAGDRIAEIASRGKVPVIVGGSGLYVRSLTHGLATLPSADESLRLRLAAQPLEELQERLRELDPVGAGYVDLKNPRRVIRALEVCILSGRPFSSFRNQSSADARIRGILLNPDRLLLRERIARRTEQMFASRVVAEVEAVREISITAQQAIGFLEIRALLAGEIDETECRSRITLQTQQYAKRQLTWFRRDITWDVLDLPDEEPASVTATRIAQVLSAGKSALGNRPQP